jgi:hypothetical protein
MKGGIERLKRKGSKEKRRSGAIASVKYGVRSQKFIWAPCAQLNSSA